MKNLKIGVTLGLKDNKESIWSNGIKQNVLIFLNLLKKSENNYNVCILNTINVDWSEKPDYLKDIDIYNFKDKFMEMDLLVIMGAQVHNNDLDKFKEDKNKRKEYMREYMRKRYSENVEKARAYKNSIKYKVKYDLPAEDLKEYGEYLADIYKIRQLKKKIPSILWEKCLQSL